MSFDLALDRGDLSVGADGDVEKFRNTSKAAQDVLKVVHTPLSSNPFFPQIGSTLTALNIGELLTQDFAETKVEDSIAKSIQIIQAIQKNQELQQDITPEEKILEIAEVSAVRDEKDPRQFNISITIVTGALSTISLPSFAISTAIGGEV